MLLNILSGFTYKIITRGIIFFFSGLVPLAFIIAFSGLELGIAFIQSQVFIVIASLGLALGFVSSGLFICAGGVLYDRCGTKLIIFYRGIVQSMPIFSITHLAPEWVVRILAQNEMRLSCNAIRLSHISQWFFVFPHKVSPPPPNFRFSNTACWI